MRKTRIKGTAAARSYAVPLCSSCKSRMQRNDKGEWFCLACADDWLKSYVEAKSKHSIGGVELPYGVKDERKRVPSFTHLAPNRRYRRALAKHGK